MARPDFLYDLCDQLNTCYKIKDRLCMTCEEYAEISALNLCANKNLMHVSIDPNTGSYLEKNGEGQLFHTNDCFIGKEYGFFFLISHSFKDDALKGILDKLQLMGIGADKSSGKGYFQFESKELHNKKFFHVSNADHASAVNEVAKHMVLSLVHPSDNDRGRLAASGKSCYKVATRKGKRENSYMEFSPNMRIEKDRIFVFQEGSVFDFAIEGSSPPVCSETVCSEPAFEVKDFGYAYRIKLPW
jgi:CRISPR type III-A-associated RAMP protein Csm4